MATRVRLQLVVPADADPAIVAILEIARTDLEALGITRLVDVEKVPRRENGVYLSYKLKVSVTP